MPKTNAEKQREYRERKKAKRVPKPPKPPAKTSRERVRLYRERKRLATANQQHQQEPEHIFYDDPTPGTSRDEENMKYIEADQVSVILKEDENADTDTDYEVPDDNTNELCVTTRKEYDTRYLSDEFGHVCIVCDRLWFKSDLRAISTERLIVLAPDFPNITDKDYRVCASCYKSLKSAKHPLLYKTNGFSYVYSQIARFTSKSQKSCQATDA